MAHIIDTPLAMQPVTVRVTVPWSIFLCCFQLILQFLPNTEEGISHPFVWVFFTCLSMAGIPEKLFIYAFLLGLCYVHSLFQA